MRLLPESEISRRCPSLKASRGYWRLADPLQHEDGLGSVVVLLALASLVAKSGSPTTKSAGAPLVVGMWLKISTRLLPKSVTINRVPSVVTETGSHMELALGVARQLWVVKLGCPSTTSAFAPLLVGIEL